MRGPEICGIRCRSALPILSGIMAAGLSGLLLAGCKDDPPPRREPPPPVASARPNACAQPLKPNDPSNLEHLPAKVADFCLDPTGSDKGYGEGAKSPLDGIFDVFDGEGEVYKRFEVKRVVHARYVDGKGSSATIDVYLSRYASPEHAFAMFGKRTVGDLDPAHPDTPSFLEAGGRAALGMGNAYLWRGAFLAELTYNDDQASQAQITARAKELLPQLAKQLGETLPGEASLPAAVAALPSEDRLPLGAVYDHENVLAISGAGPGAYGYYRKGDERWRVLSKVEADEARAKDVLRTIGGGTGTRVQGLGDEAVRIFLGDPRAEWLVARKGNRILGIGDEKLALRAGMSAAEHDGICLDGDEKRARLEQLLQR